MRRTIEIQPGTKIAHLGGRPPRVVLVLLIVQVGAFLAYAFADGPAWVGEFLAASAAHCLMQLWLHQPLTALFVHLGSHSLLFNGVSLWIFGSALERFWGSRRFLLFFLVTGAFGLFVGVVVGLVQPRMMLAGSAGATVAMMVATAIIFPNHLVSFFGLLPIKTKIFAIALAAFVVVGNLFGRYFLEIAVQVSGALIALLFLFPPRQLIGRIRLRRTKRKLKVIEGGNKKRYLN